MRAPYHLRIDSVEPECVCLDGAALGRCVCCGETFRCCFGKDMCLTYMDAMLLVIARSAPFQFPTLKSGRNPVAGRATIMRRKEWAGPSLRVMPCEIANTKRV